MRRTFHRVLCLTALVAAAFSAQGTDALWYNNGIIPNAQNPYPPQIDATTFVNEGIIDVLTTEPFETANTLFYTNRGTMDGAVGFRFSYNPSITGVPALSQNFNNRLGGTIAAHPLFLFITPNGFESPNYMYVDSTNLLNQGIMMIEAGGEMIVHGGHIDFNRGGTGVEPLFGNGSYNNTPTNGMFQPDLAIDDIYWGVGTNRFDTGNIIQILGQFFIASSPPHPVQSSFPGGTINFLTSVTVFNPYGSAYTNLVGSRTITITNMDGSTFDMLVATNITRQAVFVGAAPGYNVDIRFFPSTIPTNLMRTVALEVSTPSTNLVTAVVDNATLYFVDTLASETNNGLYTNYLTTITDPGALTYRPGNYLLSRLPVIEFLAGGPGNALITPDFLYETSWSNRTIMGNYSGYSADVDSLISRPPPVAGGTVTNLSGRVTVVADESINLNRARLQAAGLLTLKSPHLITSTNAVVDSENLTLELGSTNGHLRIQNLMKERVFRMNGQVYAWSGMWTNSATQVFTNNWLVSTNASPTNAPITNVVSVSLHALIFDASSLLDTVPVLTHDLELKSTNIVFDDRAQVVEELLLDSESFTLNGSMNLWSNAANWTAATAPSLLYFTNYGNLSLESAGVFGFDRAMPYINYVNRGVIEAVGQTIDADNLDLSGTNRTWGALNLISRAAKVESGFLDAGGDLNLLGDVFRFKGSQLLIGGRLNLSLNASGSLSDTGGGSGNDFTCNDGFSMLVKPATGDLLGTTVHSVSPQFALVGHTWAGEDRGATTNGYSDNVALGILSLEPDSIFSDFQFQGAGVSNGLYVDVLDLTLLPDYEGRLSVAPNLTIYFAWSEGVPTEELDGALGGRLRWVRDYAGPNSSVEVLLPDGRTIQVNRALRESTQIDSDGDGLANGYDPSPFDPVMITQVTVSPGQPSHATISWLAAANTSYTVECSSTGHSNDWQPLLSVTNTAPSSGMITVQDPDAISDGLRYYRVYYKP